MNATCCMKPARLFHYLTPLLLVGLLTHLAIGEVAFQKEEGRLIVTVDDQPFAVYG